MNPRFLLTPLALGSFLGLAACSAASSEPVGSASGADTASCATTELNVQAGLIDDLRAAMADGAATDPHRVEIPGGLVVVSDVAGSETISTVMGVETATNAGPDEFSAVSLGQLPLDGPLGVESGNAAKALYDAMAVDGVESKGTIAKRSGPLSCMMLEFAVSNIPQYFCRITNLTEVAHGFDGTGTTLTFRIGTIAAIRDALKAECVTANGFAVSGSLSATIEPGGGPDHVTSVDGIETLISAEPTKPMTADFGGWNFGADDRIYPGDAAAKVFAAMTRATETYVPTQHLTVRTSANGRIVCRQRIEKASLYGCSITDVDWQTIAEGAAATPGLCAAH